MALPLFWIAAAGAAALIGGAGALLSKNKEDNKKSEYITRARPVGKHNMQDYVEDALEVEYATDDEYVEYEPAVMSKENRDALKRIEESHKAILKACHEEKIKQIRENSQKRKKAKSEGNEQKGGLEADRDKASNLKGILKYLREAAGFTAEEFGQRLDLSRQAIANLENSTTKLTVSQYYAIIAFLMFQEGPRCLVKKFTFVIVLDCLVENCGNYTDQARKDILTNLKFLGTVTMAAVRQFDNKDSKEMAAHFAEEIARISNEGRL